MEKKYVQAADGSFVLLEEKAWDGSKHPRDPKGSATGGQFTSKIEKFLDKFPDDASSWANATDEVRDMARAAREHYNDMELNVLYSDPKALQGLDFRAFKTPAEWNKKGKEYIRSVYSKMKPKNRALFEDRVIKQFGL